MWGHVFNAYLRGVFAAVLVHISVQAGLKVVAALQPQPPKFTKLELSFDQKLDELKQRINLGCADDETKQAVRALYKDYLVQSVRDRVLALWETRGPCPQLEATKAVPDGASETNRSP